MKTYRLNNFIVLFQLLQLEAIKRIDKDTNANVFWYSRGIYKTIFPGKCLYENGSHHESGLPDVPEMYL